MAINSLSTSKKSSGNILLQTFCTISVNVNLLQHDFMQHWKVEDFIYNSFFCKISINYHMHIYLLESVVKWITTDAFEFRLRITFLKILWQHWGPWLLEVTGFPDPQIPRQMSGGLHIQLFFFCKISINYHLHLFTWECSKMNHDRCFWIPAENHFFINFVATLGSMVAKSDGV